MSAGLVMAQCASQRHNFRQQVLWETQSLDHLQSQVPLVALTICVVVAFVYSVTALPVRKNLSDQESAAAVALPGECPLASGQRVEKEC